METVSNVLPGSVTPSVSATRSDAFGDLKTQDFLRLLITQLTQQDPLEPTDNAALLEQLSSIRNIELSSSLTDSLRDLTGQQNFASASALIGQYVKGVPDESGFAQEGVVTAIHVAGSGKPILQLANGGALPLESVQSIEPPLNVAEKLKGLTVLGVDVRTNGQAIEGVVSEARLDDRGQTVLELETGEELRLQDVVQVASAVA